MSKSFKRQAGLTMVELLVAMAISLVVVLAAVYVYLSSTEAQRVQDRNSTSNETGAFAMQLLGRAIMNAGFYPATVPPIPVDAAQYGMYDTYPPIPSNPRVNTDWARPADNWPPAAFQSGVFGCDGAQLNTQTSTCGATVANTPDTLVINYFTSDAMGNGAGTRMDCTGSDVAGDSSNSERNKDSSGAVITTGPPRLPLFASNRYTLSTVNVYVGQSAVTTKSLACSGNGSSPHGTANAAAYQPMLAGIEDMQFTYGVYSSETSLSPDRFYTATQVNALGNLSLNGLLLSGWQRVVSIRVCLLTKTLNGNTRISDASSSPRTYTDCYDTVKNQPNGETFTRFVQVFGARNNLKQSY